ncbi:MAG: hypothetical protein HY689_11095 [Chloroflexi bacterium]|nr:hypothetical protein [Chloroflexota bacterium]
MPKIFALIFIALGLLYLFNPRLGWYLSEGWKFRNAEPSDAALVVGRVAGAVAMLVGLWLFVAW